MTCPRRGRRHDGGQATPLVTIVMALAALAVLGIAHLGSVAVAAARSQGVADLVALAAAVHGDPHGVARANRGLVLAIRPGADPGSVVVDVETAGVAATAAAAPAGRDRTTPAATPPPRSPDRSRRLGGPVSVRWEHA